MKKTVNLTESSDLFNKINALPLPRSERLEAVDALMVSDRLSAAVYWAVEKLKRLAGWLNPHPKFKPE
jgi:hypothetical protein